MTKQPPRWLLAICGIGFLLTLILEIISFSRVPHSTLDAIGSVIGSDFIGAIGWLFPVTLWENVPARWGRILATGVCFLVALAVVYINLRAWK